MQEPIVGGAPDKCDKDMQIAVFLKIAYGFLTGIYKRGALHLHDSVLVILIISKLVLG